MKLSTANIVAAVVVASVVAPNGASASLADTTEQRELWGSGWYKWTPKEPEECYDVRRNMSFFPLISFGYQSAILLVTLNLSRFALQSHLLFILLQSIPSTV